MKALCRIFWHKHTSNWHWSGFFLDPPGHDTSHAECLRCGEPRKDTKACVRVTEGGSMILKSCHGWYRDFPKPYRHDTPEEQARWLRMWRTADSLVEGS